MTTEFLVQKYYAREINHLKPIRNLTNSSMSILFEANYKYRDICERCCSLLNHDCRHGQRTLITEEPFLDAQDFIGQFQNEDNFFIDYIIQCVDPKTRPYDFPFCRKYYAERTNEHLVGRCPFFSTTKSPTRGLIIVTTFITYLI